jgi:hypothetical protein
LELWQIMNLIFQDSMRLWYWTKAGFQQKFVREEIMDFGFP